MIVVCCFDRRRYVRYMGYGRLFSLFTCRCARLMIGWLMIDGECVFD